MDRCNYYILVLFNIKKPHLGNNTNPEWLDYRLEIFRRYTLRSLLNQTDNRFRFWMTCLEESESVLAPKIEAMRKKDSAMAVVDFVFDEAKACSRLEGNDRSLYFLKIDSDDLYHRDTIAKTREVLDPLGGIPMLMFCDGYIYDIRTGKMSIFIQWSPPNIAVKYSPGTFNCESFLERCICNITKVRERFRPIILIDRMVCGLDHDMNLHDDPRRGGMERGRRTGQQDYPFQTRAPAILKEFGVEI